MVTRGGVALDGVNLKTMESKIIPNLYFAGEVLDIDGDSGGYNLQAAFSTGFLAARSIYKKRESRWGKGIWLSFFIKKNFKKNHSKKLCQQNGH